MTKATVEAAAGALFRMPVGLSDLVINIGIGDPFAAGQQTRHPCRLS